MSQVCVYWLQIQNKTYIVIVALVAKCSDQAVQLYFSCISVIQLQDWILESSLYRCVKNEKTKALMKRQLYASFIHLQKYYFWLDQT